MTALSPRQHRLWALLSGRKKITTGDVWAINRLRLKAPKRTTTRGDLRLFCQLGLLSPHGPEDARWYEPVGVAS
ncbi:hypothetical protein GCM10010400_76200 [Streptomyces aculeolatus]|uniref:hypothetical protein n=1 Tax=Streptomyces aculeolatus TaxID=270689 RepID=UPI001CECEBEE|nr:hypothetical protein [Streptomyces aculeolatus]